jgi:uncharacterized membrane protein
MDTALRICTGCSMVLLVAGSLLWLASPVGDRTDIVLNTGLALLMATPVARLLSALLQEIRARDWRFAALGFAVLGLLACSVVLALE